MTEAQLINYYLWLKDRGFNQLPPATLRQEPILEAESTPADEQPRHEAAAAPEIQPEWRIAFLSAGALEPAEEDMLHRIASALGLESYAYQIFAKRPDAGSPEGRHLLTQPIVALGSDAAGLVPTQARGGITVITHPKAMLRDPSLKKAAWDSLQKLKTN